VTETAVMLWMDDPNWASFLPETPSGGPKCGLPAHEDCSPVDPDAAARHLDRGGVLADHPGYEVRSGQLDVLRAVIRAFNARRHLMIEAGTGVGKSLAYLVPSVLWSFVNDTPVVISTATRNLQSQLLANDLPRAVRTLGADAPRFRAAVLKGRANYLCLHALGEAMQGGWYAFLPEERDAFRRVAEWLHVTTDGDLDTVDAGALRPRLSCAPEDCAGRSCPHYGRCFVMRARARAQRAHLVVANHALVLAEAANPGAGLLPAYGRLVFDEAHDLESVATEFFSSEFSRATLQQLLGRLSRLSRFKRGARRRGLLGAVARQLERGALRDAPEAAEIHALTTAAEVDAKLVQATGDELLAVFARLFEPAPAADRLRYRCMPNRQYSRAGLFADYTPSEWDEPTARAALLRFENALARLQGGVSDLAGAIQRASERDELPLFDDLVLQAQTLAASFTQYLCDVKFVLAGTDPDHVFWVEKVPDAASGAVRRRRRRESSAMFSVRLAAAPLSVADEMKRCFFDAKDSVVLCSATLRVGDKFDYMARRLGFPREEPDRAQALVASSPFDYLRQTLVFAPDFLPSPAEAGASCVAALAPFLAGLFTATKGRGLTLFTSYEMMRDTAAAARPLLAAAGIDLLVQGEGLTREAMAETLKNADAAHPLVLFGAQSFWEGVDVPGAALSCVVLARIPFPQVGEPIVEARTEKIEAAGGSAFRDYMLPEAVIRFRQGFGRLVRTKSDRGVVVFADARVATKNYGTLLRRAVPTAVHTVHAADDLFARVADFFNGSDIPH